MFKIPKQAYTPEFKEGAVQRVKRGQGIGAVAKNLVWTGAANLA